MGRIDIETKLEIVDLYRSGLTVRQILSMLNSQDKNVTRQHVRYWIRQYDNGKFDIGLVRERQGGVGSVAQRDIDIIKEILDSDPNITSRDVHNALTLDGATFSLKTTQRAINAAGFTSSKPRYGQLVSEANKVVRTEFCNALIRANDMFDDVIFTDESSIQLHSNKRQSYRPKKSLNKCLPKPKHPLKLHVWAGISRRGPTKITIFEGIMDSEFYTFSILNDNLVPFIAETFPDGHRFQQDNDPKHRSLMARNFLEEHNINFPKWPAQSPDLNPIEMVWAQLKRYIAKMEPRTKDSLIECIQTFWEVAMTVEQCNNYIDHLFKVVPVCARMGGAATGDVPNRLFCERSAGKSIHYFDMEIETNETIRSKAEILNLL